MQTQSQSGAFPKMFDDVDEIQAMLNAAQAALKEKNYERTQRLLTAAQCPDPDPPRARAALRGAGSRLRSQLHNLGLIDSNVPKPVKTFDEIAQLNFPPTEGFLLSRI